MAEKPGDSPDDSSSDNLRQEVERLAQRLRAMSAEVQELAEKLKRAMRTLGNAGNNDSGKDQQDA